MGGCECVLMGGCGRVLVDGCGCVPVDECGCVQVGGCGSECLPASVQIWSLERTRHGKWLSCAREQW